MLRAHFDAEHSEVDDPLAGRHADGLVALAILGVREVQALNEGK